MGNKRKNKDKNDQIRRKIRKLEEKLKPRRRIMVYSSSDDESSCPSVDSRQNEYENRASSIYQDEPMEDTSPPRAGPSTSRAEPAPAPEQTAPAVGTTDADPSPIELDEEILNLLGDAPVDRAATGKNIHEAISSRWSEVLTNGLAKESKENIQREYLVPGNCALLAAPTLNPEAKVAMVEFTVKRDHSLYQKQQQLGTALSALAQATELLISKEPPEKVLKPLSDACRLLCDVHSQITKTRRNGVISSVNPDLKETLTNTVRDRLLFGEKLTDHLKSVQAVQRSGESLKVAPKKPFNKNQFIKNKGNNNAAKNRLNFKPLHRQAPRAEASRGHPSQRPATRSSARLQQQARPRSPPPPRRTVHRT